MSNNNHLVKVLKYNPVNNELTKFDDIRNLLTYTNDPPIETAINFDISELKEARYIFCSDFLRAKQTANHLLSLLAKRKIEVQERFFLREVKFDFASIDRSQYMKNGSDYIRQFFIDSFIHDLLGEDIASLKSRIVMLGKMNEGAQNTVFISHTFLMKLFLIYLEHQDLFEEREIIKDYVRPDKRIMKFGERFLI